MTSIRFIPVIYKQISGILKDNLGKQQQIQMSESREAKSVKIKVNHTLQDLHLDAQLETKSFRCEALVFIITKWENWKNGAQLVQESLDFRCVNICQKPPKLFWHLEVVQHLTKILTFGISFHFAPTGTLCFLPSLPFPSMAALLATLCAWKRLSVTFSMHCHTWQKELNCLAVIWLHSVVYE